MLLTVWLYVADCLQLAGGFLLTAPAWIDTTFCVAVKHFGESKATWDSGHVLSATTEVSD